MLPAGWSNLGSLCCEACTDAQNQTQSYHSGSALSLQLRASWAQQPGLQGCSPEMLCVKLVSRSPHARSRKPEFGEGLKTSILCWALVFEVPPSLGVSEQQGLAQIIKQRDTDAKFR